MMTLMNALMDRWERIEIAGAPVEVFEPSEPARGIVVFLHNAKGQTLSLSEVYTGQLQTHRLMCVAPWGGNSWWTDRIVGSYHPARSAEQLIVGDVVPEVQRRWPGLGLAILGISMGGQGALRMAFKRPDLFPIVAAVAPAIEYHEYYGQGSPIDAMYPSKEHCRQDTVPMHVNPTELPPHVFFCCDPNDQHWFRGSDRLHEKLSALGVLHECDLTTQGGGHNWVYFNRMALPAFDFVSRSMAQMARRLL